MPTELRIPDSQRPAFQALLGYDEAMLTSLQDAFATLRPTIFIRDSAAHVAEATGLEETEVGIILLMISNLFALREQPDMGRDQLLDQLAAAIKADSEFSSAAPKLEALVSFLRAVLSLDDTLGVTSKAWTVVRDFERTYCFSRILTDIRAVFRPNSDDPAAAVIVHNLKLAYHEGDELCEFFVGMTSRDLEKLKKVIERAERKEASLRAGLKSSQLPILEVE
ncbi:MAG TPA: hypothetical protein VGG03_09185 [Thermoanaerobaculia bacterium]|jgi:hypothetical protein